MNKIRSNTVIDYCDVHDQHNKFDDRISTTAIMLMMNLSMTAIRRSLSIVRTRSSPVKQ